MKVIVTALIFASFALYSCNSSNKQINKKDIVKKNAEELLNESLHDPASYEFVSLEFCRKFSSFHNS